MKNSFLMIILTTLACLPIVGCETGSSELESENEALARQNDSLQTEINTLKATGEAASQEIAALEADLRDILENAGSEELRDPSWEELKRFIALDRTDEYDYIVNEFDCEGFSISLRDNAWRRGFRCAYVAIGLGDQSAGHTLNAFQTTDRGLVYVDCTSHDTIAYVEVGRTYGTITVESVKSSLVSCDTAPDQFWQPVVITPYSGNLFAYAYYQEYMRRDRFYSDSVAAYNQEVASYNAAVRDFNRGQKHYSLAELEEWEERLDTWSANLEKLNEDLGTVRIEPLGTVTSVEIYWN